MKHPLVGMEVDVDTIPGRGDSEVLGLGVCNVVLMPAGQSQGCTLPLNVSKMKCHAFSRSDWTFPNSWKSSLRVDFQTRASFSFPQASNQTLLDKFKRQHEGNTYIEFPAVMEPAFIIRHYAGKVKYGVKVRGCLCVVAKQQLNVCLRPQTSHGRGDACFTINYSRITFLFFIQAYVEHQCCHGNTPFTIYHQAQLLSLNLFFNPSHARSLVNMQILLYIS